MNMADQLCASLHDLTQVCAKFHDECLNLLFSPDFAF